MSLKPLNSQAGFSVGTPASNIILANGDVTTSNGTFTGNVSASYFIGNGSQLSSITGSNVTGEVSYAATANSVAGANVSGQVSYAAVANSVAGANVSGQVSYAAVANSVAGANVSGTVSSATTATSATTAGTVTTAAQPNITSVGTLTSLGVSGAVTASTLVSNVATGTAPFTVTSTTQVANLNVATAGSATTAGTVTTAAQPNITSVGTLTGLTVSATITGSVSGSAGTAGTVTTAAQPNITSVGTLSGLTVSSTISGSVTGSAGTASTVTTAAQPNITSVGTLTSLTVSGNTTVGNLIGPHANGNSNVNIPAANGNVNISAVGNANILVVTGTGVNVSGTLNATGNANVANLTVGTGSGGDLTGANTITANYIITSHANLGSVSNLTITGGSSGNVLATYGNGTVYWTAGGVSGSGTTSYVPKFTGASTIGSSLIYDSGTGIGIGTTSPFGSLQVTGVVTIGSNTTGQGRMTFSSGVSPPSMTILATDGATANTGAVIIGGNYVWFSTGTSSYSARMAIDVNGNVGIANISPTHTLSVTGTFNLSGNANVGNLGTAQVLASANVTAPQLISNIATGTAPFVVTSTTKVTNLNADTVDGYDTSIASTASTIVVRDANANISANNIVGTLTTAAQTNITSVGTLGSLSVTGNVTAGNFIGILANTTSNVKIPAAAGNVTISVGGTANIIVATTTGANITGYVSATGVIVPRVATQSAGTAITTTTAFATTDVIDITSVSSNFTLTADAASSGTYYNGQRLMIRLAATASISITVGTGGTKAWNQIVQVPGTMTNGQTLYVGAVYNSNTNKWDIIAARVG